MRGWPIEEKLPHRGVPGFANPDTGLAWCEALSMASHHSQSTYQQHWWQPIQQHTPVLNIAFPLHVELLWPFLYDIFELLQDFIPPHTKPSVVSNINNMTEPFLASSTENVPSNGHMLSWTCWMETFCMGRPGATLCWSSPSGCWSWWPTITALNRYRVSRVLP